MVRLRWFLMGILDAWLKDMPQQFLGLPKIEILIAAFAKQLQEVERVFLDLNRKTDLETARGQNLDYTGTIIPLTRKEAGILSGSGNSEYVLPDDRYRQLLKYKLLINTNECTYYDLIAGLQLFWGTGNTPIYYSEDPLIPATIILRTEARSDEDIENLMSIPTPRPAGVALRSRFTLPDISEPLVVCADSRNIYAGSGSFPQIALHVRAEQAVVSLQNVDPLEVYTGAETLLQTSQSVQTSPITISHVVAGTTWQDLLDDGITWEYLLDQEVKWSDFITTIQAGAGICTQSFQHVQADVCTLSTHTVDAAETYTSAGVSPQISQSIRATTVTIAHLMAGTTWEDLEQQGITWEYLFAREIKWSDFVSTVYIGAGSRPQMCQHVRADTCDTFTLSGASWKDLTERKITWGELVRHGVTWRNLSNKGG